MSEIMILIAKGDASEKPRLYACAKCGTVHSPKIYACREEEAHEAARRAAEECYNCRTHNNCQECGKETPKGWLKCSECREASKLAKATVIEAASLDYCFGAGGEFYHSTDEAAEAGEPYVYASTFTPFRIDFDNIVENILDDHHEDASQHDLVSLNEFEAAVAKFNAAQTSGSYFEDCSRVAHLVTEGGEA
ncbi:hypothetical protein [Shinella sp.]|uniref:hypothetical protein n=2 Tax=Shinella sp. TaxID=1870904 RepID=UPI0028AB8060|nr:hypothetical protein [Shinella sp.]